MDAQTMQRFTSLGLWSHQFSPPAHHNLLQVERDAPGQTLGFAHYLPFSFC